MSKKRYQQDMERKREHDSSTKDWYIKYQVCTTINKIYKRVTKSSTHEVPKYYVLKEKKKEQGSFY